VLAAESIQEDLPMTRTETNGKLVWEKPTVEVLGDLEALTAAGNTSNFNDGTTSTSPSI
jgi:hypothetical protein